MPSYCIRRTGISPGDGQKTEKKAGCIHIQQEIRPLTHGGPCGISAKISPSPNKNPTVTRRHTGHHLPSCSARDDGDLIHESVGPQNGHQHPRHGLDSLTRTGTIGREQWLIPRSW